MGGIETHLQVLARGLRESLDLSVIVASDGRHALREVIDGVPVLRLATPLTMASAPICPAMIAQIRDSDADIVHIHLPNPMAVLSYLASGHKGRLVCSYHSDTIRQKLLGALFDPILHFALRRSSAIVAASPNYLCSSPVLSRYQDKSHVIPYGIPLEDFEPRDSAGIARIRKQYGDRLILSVGRLVYYKGFEYLIRAMTNVQGSLLIVGDGPLRPNLTALAAELGVADRVHLLGGVDDGQRLAYYHAADLFALASVARSEAFGIVQIEAMAAGKPVINTALDSGVPFVSQHGVTGLTVPPQDHQALGAAITALLDDAALRARYGKAALLRAKREFSWQMMVSRTIQLYSAVMNGPARNERRP